MIAIDHFVPIVPQESQAELLYRAIKSDQLDIMKSLLEQTDSLDIEFYEYCGDTPISLALTEGKSDLLPFLMKKTDKNFALHTAVHCKQAFIIRYLLQNCAYKEKFLRFLGLK